MLTPRLAAVAAAVTGNTLSDIGTDHAYIPIELINNGSIKSAVACDINAGPLKIAIKNVESNNLSDIITLRLGNGLEPILPSETDSVVIAGMGGVLISEILAADTEKSHSFDTLVLQPMNAQSELRKYLASAGFEIVCEDLAVEGFKVYNILTVKNGSLRNYTEFESHIPPELECHEHFPALLAKKEREFSKILSGLTCAKEHDRESIDRYRLLLDELSSLKRRRG